MERSLAWENLSVYAFGASDQSTFSAWLRGFSLLGASDGFSHARRTVSIINASLQSGINPNETLSIRNRVSTAAIIALFSRIIKRCPPQHLTETFDKQTTIDIIAAIMADGH